MVGIVLCAFFVFGVMTGFSAPGRALTLRCSNFFSAYSARIDRVAAPANPLVQWLRDAARSIEIQAGITSAPIAKLAGLRQGGAIAMVERHDGFYALFSNGELEGPVSPNAEGDLPILSGDRVEQLARSRSGRLRRDNGPRGGGTVASGFRDERG